MPPAKGMAAFSSSFNARPNAQLRTLNSASDQVPTLRNVFVVPIDDIAPIALVIIYSLAFFFGACFQIYYAPGPLFIFQDNAERAKLRASSSSSASGWPVICFTFFCHS